MKAIVLLAATLLSACTLPVNGTSPDTLPVTDAGAPKSDVALKGDAEAAAPPPNGDQVNVAVCHSASSDPNALSPRGTECPGGYTENFGAIPPGAVIYASQNPRGGCEILAAPVECSTCDYTCDCLLRYVALPDAGCTCSQSETGGILVLSDCGAP